MFSIIPRSRSLLLFLMSVLPAIVFQGSASAQSYKVVLLQGGLPGTSAHAIDHGVQVGNRQFTTESWSAWMWLGQPNSWGSLGGFNWVNNISYPFAVGFWARGIPSSPFAAVWDVRDQMSRSIHPGGLASEALGIAPNNGGGMTYVGWVQAHYGESAHAHIWNQYPNLMQDYEANPPGIVESMMFSTAQGRHVGYGMGPATGGAKHAYSWSDVIGTDIHPAGYLESCALATSPGATVGYANVPGAQHAFIWLGSLKLDIHPGGPWHSSQIEAIAPNGRMAGTGNQQGGPRAMAWSDINNPVNLHPFLPKIGNRRWVESHAHGIDNAGNVVGEATWTEDDIHFSSYAVLWQPDSGLVNTPPVLQIPPSIGGVVGFNISFTATAIDPDVPPQVLTFSLIGAPPGATINPVTGVFSWTPTSPGIYNFQVAVQDSAGGFDQKPIQIIVDPASSGFLDLINLIIDRSGPNLRTAEFDIVSTLNKDVVFSIVAAHLNRTAANPPLPPRQTIPAHGRVHFVLTFNSDARGVVTLDVAYTVSKQGVRHFIRKYNLG